MYKYLLIALVAFVFVLSSCAEPVQPPVTPDNRPMVSENRMDASKVDFDVDLYNDCCKEYVRVTGTYHLTLSEDNIHYHGTLSKLVGVSENGNIYHGGLTESIFFNLDTDNEFVQSWVMTSVGGDCQMKFKIVMHLVDGELVVDRYEYECFEN